MALGGRPHGPRANSPCGMRKSDRLHSTPAPVRQSASPPFHAAMASLPRHTRCRLHSCPSHTRCWPSRDPWSPWSSCRWLYRLGHTKITRLPNKNTRSVHLAPALGLHEHLSILPLPLPRHATLRKRAAGSPPYGLKTQRLHRLLHVRMSRIALPANRLRTSLPFALCDEATIWRRIHFLFIAKQGFMSPLHIFE